MELGVNQSCINIDPPPRNTLDQSIEHRAVHTVLTILEQSIITQINTQDYRLYLKSVTNCDQINSLIVKKFKTKNSFCHQRYDISTKKS